MSGNEFLDVSREGAAFSMDAVDKLAEQLYNALDDGDPDCFIGGFSLDEKVTVDGRFSFRAVAQHLLRGCAGLDRTLSGKQSRP